MPDIGQQAFVLAPTSAKYLSLANEEYVRQIDFSNFDNNWRRVRIGLQCAFQNTGGGNLSTYTLFVGLCNGTVYPFGSQRCVHAVGYVWGSPVAATQAETYVDNGGYPYYSGGVSYYGIRKVGVTWTTETAGSATWTHIATGGSLERRGCVFVDIEQSATQVTAGARTGATSVAASDVWYEHFQYNANQGGPPTVLEAASAQNTQTLIPGAGWNTNILNAVNILWRSPLYAMRIYAISVSFTP